MTDSKKMIPLSELTLLDRFLLIQLWKMKISIRRYCR